MTSNCFQDDQISESQCYFVIDDEFQSDLYYHYLNDFYSSDLSDQLSQQNQSKKSLNSQKLSLQTLKKDLSKQDRNNQKIQPEISSGNEFSENSKNSKSTIDNKTSDSEIQTSGNSSNESKGQPKDRLQQQKPNKRKYQKKKIPINKKQNNPMDEQVRSTEIIDNSEPFLSKKLAKNRKGKHSQSKTQRFIHFFTKYHYSKNFNQYFKKRVTEKVGDMNNYQNSSLSQKIEVINEIVQQLHSYNMAIHYNVEKGQFFQSFTHQQQDLIKRFFHKVIRKTYQIKLQLERKRLQDTDVAQKQRKRKFFQQKSEKAFTKIFESTLRQKMFASQLIECDFQYRLQEAFQSRGIQ